MNIESDLYRNKLINYTHKNETVGNLAHFFFFTGAFLTGAQYLSLHVRISNSITLECCNTFLNTGVLGSECVHMAITCSPSRNYGNILADR